MKNIKTTTLKIDPLKIDQKVLKFAGELIRKGDLVAFPTETVYGLGANALNKKAVVKIFKAKERPYCDPLIVHISCFKELEKLVDKIPEIAQKLGNHFWPGPLTMIMKKSKIVPDQVTSGLDTVAIRVPNHPIALGLIREANRPIAAPSANRFTYTSPTKASHVIDDLQGKVHLILDGGSTEVGVESTVLDITSFPLKVLRLGGTTVEEIRELVPDIIIPNDQGPMLRSPGLMKKHYSPRAKLILPEGVGQNMIDNILKVAREYTESGYRVGIISSSDNAIKYKDFFVKTIGDSQNLESCAHNLYAQMRSLDELKFDIIISENFKKRGIGRAIMDRLFRASTKDD